MGVYFPDLELKEVEEAIEEGSSDKARAAFRQFLSKQANLDTGGASVGELLAKFAETPANYAQIAAVTIRCANMQGLLEPNQSNQIIRSTVALAEGALPSFLHYLKIEPKTQNFEKFDILTRAHATVTEVLAPIRMPYGDLEAVIAARKTIIGALSHGTLKAYLSVFGLEGVRGNLEAVFGRLSKVALVEDTLLDDVEECQRTISDAKVRSLKIQTFLSRQFVIPFLETVERVLDEYLIQMRGRFVAAINLAYEGSELKKRYPLKEVGREIRFSVPLRNTGPGRAIDVKASCLGADDNIVVDTMSVMLGSVSPGEFEVSFNALIMEPSDQTDFLLTVDWGEIGSPRRQSQDFAVRVVAQSGAHDWASLEYWSPYSTDVAEGDGFVGREEMVKRLAGKILRYPMEPFYITGQKRVGKTSLAKAVAEFAQDKAHDFTVHSQYILWGRVADVDAAMSLRRLGQNIHDFLCSELPKNVVAPDTNYHGSLSDLMNVAELALSVCPSKRFVIILDEIDEIHEQLYLRGDLASTFFANLRALSRAKNICLVLVGGENMPYIMDRQGQKLNNFSRINLSYFNRTTEWDDFGLLVTKPTSGILNWHEDGVSEVYNATSGNPYFAKLICAGVTRKAITERDTDITAREVKAATEAEISMLGSNSFVHLWQDGIPRAVDEREPDILRRVRVLVAVARCLRKHLEPTAENIADCKATPALLGSEIPPVLNDFTRREVIVEQNGQYTVALPIFRMWLVDVGAAHLVADALSEEIAESVLAEENNALVRSEEIVHLVESWPTYCGRKIGTDEVRAWFEQVESKLEQRNLFDLLCRLKIYGEPAVRERMRSLHANLRQELPVPVRRSKNERRSDILISYVDGPAKSGAGYAALYAEENGVHSSLVCAPERLRETFEKRITDKHEINAVIIVDDIAATGGTLATHLNSFLSQHQDLLSTTKIRVFSVVSTEEGQAAVLDALKKFSKLDVDFRVGEVLLPTDRAFPKDQIGWPNKQAREQIEALARDLGSRIYKNDPLGYGDLGLLLVFPNTVPNNTLPIFHSPGKQLDKPWKPLFPRPIN